jgi:hypothetical protein
VFAAKASREKSPDAHIITVYLNLPESVEDVIVRGGHTVSVSFL